MSYWRSNDVETQNTNINKEVGQKKIISIFDEGASTPFSLLFLKKHCYYVFSLSIVDTVFFLRRLVVCVSHVSIVVYTTSFASSTRLLRLARVP